LSAHRPEGHSEGHGLIPAPDEWAIDAVGPQEPSNPAYVAIMWSNGLRDRSNYLTALRVLSAKGREAYWGDFSEAARRLGNKDQATGVQFEGDRVAYVRFVDAGPGETSLYVDGPVLLPSHVLTLVFEEDGWWHAYSFGDYCQPLLS